MKIINHTAPAEQLWRNDVDEEVFLESSKHLGPNFPIANRIVLASQIVKVRGKHKPSTKLT